MEKTHQTREIAFFVARFIAVEDDLAVWSGLEDGE